MNTDWRLLREYGEHASEVAFTRLVDKHMRLVYATCRRETGDDSLAQDAAQAVFLLLAQKAGTFRHEINIAGWLFTASRLVSRNAVRREHRRRRIEQEATRDMPQATSFEPAWCRIDPYLNDALAALSDTDRAAVLMRFFDGLSVKEVAGELGVEENTATKRISRALEKMRRLLLRKDVAVPVVALASLLAEHSAKAAPDTCRAATLLSVHALASPTGAVAPGLAALHEGVHFTMQALRYKCLIIGCAAFVAVSVATPPIMRAVRAQTAGRATFSDPGAATAPAATTADRAEIDKDYAVFAQKIVDLVQGQPYKIEPWQNARYVDQVVALDGTVKSSMMKDLRTSPPMVNPPGSLTEASFGITIKAFQIQGGDAFVTYDCTLSGRITDKMKAPFPAGSILQTIGRQSDVWQKIDGRWTMVGPQSHYGQPTAILTTPDGKTTTLQGN